MKLSPGIVEKNPEPHIGNRSDALDLLNELIESVQDETAEKLRILRDAVERNIL